MLFSRKKFKKRTKEEEEAFFEDLRNEGGLEKRDIPAMIFSAYLVFIPVVLLIFLVFALVAMLYVW